MKIRAKEKTKKNVVIKLSQREADILLSILVDANQADDRYDFLSAEGEKFIVRLMHALRNTDY